MVFELLGKTGDEGFVTGNAAVNEEDGIGGHGWRLDDWRCGRAAPPRLSRGRLVGIRDNLVGGMATGEIYQQVCLSACHRQTAQSV